MTSNRYTSHSVSDLKVHLVWVTKYRYKVLRGDIQLRCRDLIKQTCDALDVKIIKGVVSGDHIHLHVSYLPSLSVSDMARRIKGRSAAKLLGEHKELRKRYWGGHLWGIGFGAWSVGNLTEDMINDYLDHHNTASNQDDSFVLE